MYIEASSPRKKGDNALIGSAVFKPTSTCKLRFFYHMYGSHIGILNVYTRTSTSGSMKQIWTKTGDQGNNWVKGTASISVAQNFQVSSAGLCVLFNKLKWPIKMRSALIFSNLWPLSCLDIKAMISCCIPFVPQKWVCKISSNEAAPQNSSITCSISTVS